MWGSEMSQIRPGWASNAGRICIFFGLSCGLPQITVRPSVRFSVTAYGDRALIEATVALTGAFTAATTSRAASVAGSAGPGVASWSVIRPSGTAAASTFKYGKPVESSSHNAPFALVTATGSR